MAVIVIFYVKDESNDILPVAVYEPTRLTKVAVLLDIDDKIEIGYGAHNKLNNLKTLNLEYLLVKELKETSYFKNPLCEKCGKSMKSEGEK